MTTSEAAAVVAPPEPPGERMRASRLRAKTRRGETLQPDDVTWLTEYEAARGATRGVRRNRSTSGATVHVTQPCNDNLDPGAFMWEPKVPPPPTPSPDDAPPDTDRPATGTPLIDAAPVTSTGGDPVAAQQFAQLVMFLCAAGVSAGRELLATSPFELPADIRALIGSDEHVTKGVLFVGGAAERVALKYGFKQIPMADEVIVGGAVAGSALLLFHNFKRKTAEKKPAPPVVATAAKPDEKRDTPPPPPANENADQVRSMLWGS